MILSEKPRIELIQGDTLEILKTMSDESIDCIITSPPYYGLRYYGTAKWEGGYEKCEHIQKKEIKPITTGLGYPIDGGARRIGENNNYGKAHETKYKEICGKCGAKRIDRQIGLEKTLDEYLNKLLLITAELKRVLKKTGTMWWNHGTSYSAYGKCDTMQNYRLVLKMIDQQGWILRNQIIWYKPNCMPSSVLSRFTVDFEPVFFLTKSKKYWFEPQYEIGTGRSCGNKSIKGEGQKGFEIRDGITKVSDVKWFNRNRRCVWKIPTQPFKGAHFATFPEKLIEPMVKAGCPEFICNKCGKTREKIFKNNRQETRPGNYSKYTERPEGLKKRIINNPIEIGYTDCGCNSEFSGGMILDPFAGAGTTGVVAIKNNRQFIGIELNPEYIEMARKRIENELKQQCLF